MVIVRPITRTIISTTSFGNPVVDAVNKLVTDVAALQAATALGPWMVPNWVNGWTGDLRFRRIGDHVYFLGSAAGAAPTLSNMFVLPTGFFPGIQLELSCVARNASGIAAAQFSVKPGGGVNLTAGPSGPITATYLTGLNFPLTLT